MALIPPHYLRSVVALGLAGEDGERRWVASGFHYFHRVGDVDGEARYSAFLVTNRHVIDREGKLYVRVNPMATGAAREYEMDAGLPHWHAHPDPGVDVAVSLVNHELIRNEGLDVYFIQSDTDCARVEQMREAGVSEGDFVYVLGFPMGLIGAERDTVIARSGSVARVRDLFDGGASTFILDASVFPGNSGGPVLLRPEGLSITGTPAITTSYVIGVVAGYLYYEDVAISPQSQRTRVTFEENSGLAVVFPMDAVADAVEHALAGVPEDERVEEQSQSPDEDV